MNDSAADRVYADVKEQILTSALRGGDLISEGEIADRCNVSRTPVREAFLRLAAEGWMRLYPKRGAFIVPVSDREARDVLDARVLIESHAVRSVVGRPEELADLGRALADNLERHRNADLSEFAVLDAEFHQLIVAAGDNALLADMYVSLGERHRRMTTTRLHRGGAVADQIFADHEALAATIAAGDADEFASGLAAHLSGVHDIPGGPR